MNRNERSRLMIKTRSFLSEVLPVCRDYVSFLDDVLNAENDKLSNIPEEFSSSQMFENISEECEILEEARDNLDEFITQVEDLPNELGIQMRKPRTKGREEWPNKKTASQVCPGKDEKRTERFQMALTPSLMKRLKKASENEGKSMNEVVFQIIDSNLLKTDESTYQRLD